MGWRRGRDMCFLVIWDGGGGGGGGGFFEVECGGCFGRCERVVGKIWVTVEVLAMMVLVVLIYGAMRVDGCRCGHGGRSWSGCDEAGVVIKMGFGGVKGGLRVVVVEVR